MVAFQSLDSSTAQFILAVEVETSPTSLMKIPLRDAGKEMTF